MINVFLLLLVKEILSGIYSSEVFVCPVHVASGLCEFCVQHIKLFPV